MKQKLHTAIAAASLACGCAPAEPATTTQSSASRANVTVAARASTTITGQPTGMPPAPFEAVISVTDLPPGGVLPMHKHPWPRYVYVDRGRISVTYEAAGLTREFGAGEGVIEAIDQWHEGRVVGSEPVRLVLFDQVPPGATNVVTR
jgi:quercetin dioxygenase-like cupin family protein